jgi:hypothetical protein
VYAPSTSDAQSTCSFSKTPHSANTACRAHSNDMHAHLAPKPPVLPLVAQQSKGLHTHTYDGRPTDKQSYCAKGIGAAQPKAREQVHPKQEEGQVRHRTCLCPMCAP